MSSLKERMEQIKARNGIVPVSVPAEILTPTEFPATPLGELQSKLAELKTAMLEEHPMIPRLLQTIHKVMLEQGDLVVCLSDEEIGTFIQALKNHMNVTVVAEKTKKATSSAALKKASAAELSGGMDSLAALAEKLGVQM